jgi:hypothetical protein
MSADRRVWKFGPLQVNRTERLTMPKGAQLLGAAYVAPEGLMIWSLVDAEAEECDRNIHIYPTGSPVHEGAVYLCSWMAGPMVWHVFDLGEQP